MNPKDFFNRNYLEATTEQPRGRNRVLSVEALDGGCLLIRVDFERAKHAGSPAPLRKNLSKGKKSAVEAASIPQRAFDESPTIPRSRA